MEGGGQPSCEQCLRFRILLSFFEFTVGGLGFEFCVLVVGWRHALQSEGPVIISIKFGSGLGLSWPPGDYSDVKVRGKCLLL